MTMLTATWCSSTTFQLILQQTLNDPSILFFHFHLLYTLKFRLLMTSTSLHMKACHTTITTLHSCSSHACFLAATICISSKGCFNLSGTFFTSWILNGKI